MSYQPIASSLLQISNADFEPEEKIIKIIHLLKQERDNCADIGSFYTRGSKKHRVKYTLPNCKEGIDRRGGLL